MKKKTAFTLSEVLIALTVIGIIAVLTVPNLMQKWQDHQQITAAKEAYSILDNAIKMAVVENGPITGWNFPSDSNEKGVYFGQMIKPYLKVTKDCSRDRLANCFRYGYYGDGTKVTKKNQKAFGHTYLDFHNNASGNVQWNPAQQCTRFILSNGMRVFMRGFDLNKNFIEPNQNYLNTILVDTNGEQGPNKVGYDVFFFGINSLGLSSKPCIASTWRGNSPIDCSLDYTGSVAGCSCYYWITKHGNMDYKRRVITADEW